MLLKPGDRIGDWIVDDILGEGGMGAVYRAHSTLTDRLEAAVKVMKPALGPEFRARFVREAEALSALRHPAIVRVMGFSEDPKRGLLYLVMELAYGETLKARMGRGPMDLPEALRVFVPLASALDHAHEEEIFHRDLKPANVVLCEDGPRLVDFGIAAAPAGQTLTDGTGQLGTLAYLPPEVFRGDLAEPHAIDVYGFALLLHEALSGTRVFPVDPRMTPAAAAAAVGVRKLQQGALDPGEPHPEKLREMVRRATDPSPAARPRMADMRQTLESLVERRGRVAVKGATGTTTGEVRIATPQAEHTMRVPDPPKPAIGDSRTATPVRFKAPPRRRGTPTWVPIVAAAGGLAILLALGLALLGGDDDSREGGASPAPSASAYTRAPGGGPVFGGAGQGGSTVVLPSPVGGATPAAGTPAGTPTSSAPPAFGAVPPAGTGVVGGPPPGAGAAPPGTAGAAPVQTQAPAPRPPAPATRPPDTYPEPSPVAEPFVVTPEVVPEDPPFPEESPTPDPSPSPTVTGEWALVNEIRATAYAPFHGLVVGYRLRLRQEGTRVSGEGVKVSENGVTVPSSARTPIRVEGSRNGRDVVLRFVEQGTQRASSGTFQWRMAGPGRLSGRFASDAARSSGSSVASRLP